MSGERKGRPSFELARVYEDGRREVEAIELRNVGGIFTKGARVAMGRRGFLGISALSTGALLAACDIARATTTTQPTPAPPPTVTPRPTPLPPLPMGIATGGGALVYSGAYYSAPVTFKLPAKTRFPVLARDSTGGWLFMHYNYRGKEHDGWVKSAVVALDPPMPPWNLPIANAWDVASTPGPTPTPRPTPVPTATPDYGGGGGGGGYCSCNEVCVCIPVFY